MIDKSICVDRLRKLSKMGGELLDPSLNISITDGVSYDKVDYLAGKVFGLDKLIDSSVYEEDCYTIGCFNKSGTWSKAIKYETRSWEGYTSYYPDCFEDCYAPYKSIERIKDYKDQECAYEPGVYEQCYLPVSQSYNRYEEIDCDSSSNNPIQVPYIDYIDTELLIQGQNIYNLYTFKKDIRQSINPYVEGAYEQDVYTPCNFDINGEIQYVVGKDGPYETGVYTDDTYKKDYYLFYRDLSLVIEQDCYDDCTYNTLIPIGIYNHKYELELRFCNKKEVPTIQEYIDSESNKIQILKSSCIGSSQLVDEFWDDDFIINDELPEKYLFECGLEEGCYEEMLFYYHLDGGVYEDDVFHPGVYVNKTLYNIEPFIDKYSNPCCRDLSLKEISLVREILEYNYTLETYGKDPISTVIGPTRGQLTESSRVDPCNYIDVWKGKMYKVINGDITYWVDGIGPNGSSYVVDIGYLDPITKQLIIKEENLPVTAGGKYKSTKSIPPGIKVVILKRIKYNSIEQIGVTYGLVPEDINLIRTKGGSNLYYNPEDQYVNLEELSITLSLITLSGYKEDKLCSQSNNNYYLEPDLKEIVDNNLSKLSTLLDPSSNSNRLNSIPLNLTSYIEAEDIYNDEKYIQQEIRCYEKGVYTLGCNYIWNDEFIVGDNIECTLPCFETLYSSPTSRLVSNKAIAWLLLTYCTHWETFREDWVINTIQSLSIYLINQIDKRRNLLPLGWTHNDIYSNSTIIESYESETNIVTIIALLRVYDLTHDYLYLDRATDIYQALDNYLYSYEDRVYLKELDNPIIDSNSLTYGLWLAISMNKVETVEASINQLRLKVKPPITESQVPISSNGEVIRDWRTDEPIYIEGELAYSSLEEHPYILSPYYKSDLDEDIMEYTKDIIFNDYLNTSTREGIQSIGYFIGFESLLKDRLSLLWRGVQQGKITHTSTLMASCITNRLHNHKLFHIRSRYDVETLIMSRNFLYERLKHSIPTNFGWFSEKSLGPKGNLGQILLSFSKIMATWNTGFNRLIKASTLYESNGSHLDRYTTDLELPRWNGETEEDYKYRVSSYLLREANTSKAIIDLLALYGLTAYIDEPLITNYDTFNSMITRDMNYSPIITNSKLSGEDTNPVIYINTDYPINKNIDSEIRKVKPLGVKHLYRYSLQFNSCDFGYKDIVEGLSINPNKEILPSIEVTPYCCYEPNSCSRAIYKIKLSHPSSKLIYVNYINDEFVINFERGERSLGIIKPGDIEKVIIIEPYEIL